MIEGLLSEITKELLPRAGALATLLVGILYLWGRSRARAGKVAIRKLPAVDAIDDVIHRSAEAGRPVSFTTGLTDLGPLLFSCLGVLRYVAKKAARLRIKLFVPVRESSVLAVTEETVRQAFASEGSLHRYDSSWIKFLSEEQFAFTSGYIGLLTRERVGGAILLGEFAAESLILADAGQRVGAMQVAGTVNPEQVSFFVATCDFTMIGEELFGASAYLSQEPTEVGSIWAQDICKMILMVVMIVGMVGWWG